MESRIRNKVGLGPRKVVGAERGKKVYPAIQWRPLRVMNPWQKAGLLVALVAVNAVLFRLFSLVLPGLLVYIVTEPFWLVAVISLARSFRGTGEAVQPPRAWWRLTARPLAGFVLGAMYALSVVYLFLPDDHTSMNWVNTVEALFLGLVFLNSSIRLTIARRRAQ
jgi:hypothetical protein